MSSQTNNISLIVYGLALLLALVILLDFCLPGKVYREEVISIQQEQQQHYNPSGNYHYSYQVKTPTHRFSASEAFAKSAKKKQIKYSVSLIFNEVNRYSLLDSDDSSVYSFRLVSGLIYPLLMLIIIVLAYLFNKKINNLIIVLMIILVADLVILMQ